MASADCVAKVLSRSMTCEENSPGVFLLTRARRGPARRRGARAGKLEPGYHHRDHRAVAGLASPGRLRDGALGRLWRAHVIRARRSEEHTSELQSHHELVCRLLLEKKKKRIII